MKTILLYLSLSFFSVNAYKILIYSAPLGYSHTIFMGRIADILQEAGHNVTVLHPVWQQQHLPALSTLANKVLFPLPERLASDLQPRNIRVWNTNSRSILDQVQLLSAHTDLQVRSCDYEVHSVLLSDNGTMQMLENERFDAGITEMLGTCGFGIFNRIGLDHMIAASAVGLAGSMDDYYDVPKLPSIVPSFLLPYSGRMNFAERTINFLVVALADLFSWELGRKYKSAGCPLFHCRPLSPTNLICGRCLSQSQTGRRYAQNSIRNTLYLYCTITLPGILAVHIRGSEALATQTIKNVMSNINSSDLSLLFMAIAGDSKEVWNRFGIITDDEFYKSKINYLLSNSDEFLEFGRPTSPKIVHIGGITALEAAPLSQKLQRIMERTKMGAVYISFGSVPSTKEMPKHFRDAIVEVAKTFENYDFIWKVDEEDTIQNVSNLHTFSWVSQRALLAHPNLRCFVSHAGLNSVLELTRKGKPSILVPFFGDQVRNARYVEVKNTTIVIAKEEFNFDNYAAALRQVLNDESYSQRAERLASLMVNKPFSVKDRLLSTVEFSIRHGRIYDLDIGKHLNTIQYYSVDVVAFLFSCFLSVLIIWLYIFKYFCQKILRKKVKKE